MFFWDTNCIFSGPLDKAFFLIHCIKHVLHAFFLGLKHVAVEKFDGIAC